MTMGEIIKMLRLQAKMTQEELGVQKSAVRKWEKGEVENIKRTTIALMAKIFNVSPCYLQIQNQYGKDSVQLLQYFTELNELGRSKALGSVADLTEKDNTDMCSM